MSHRSTTRTLPSHRSADVGLLADSQFGKGHSYDLLFCPLKRWRCTQRPLFFVGIYVCVLLLSLSVRRECIASLCSREPHVLAVCMGAILYSTLSSIPGPTLHSVRAYVEDHSGWGLGFQSPLREICRLPRICIQLISNYIKPRNFPGLPSAFLMRQGYVEWDVRLCVCTIIPIYVKNCIRGLSRYYYCFKYYIYITSDCGL